MARLIRCTFLSALMCFSISVSLHAEERVKSELEKSIPIPKAKADLTTQRRARVSEEQAVNQLKFMMVKGWARMEKELLETKGFKPFGMVLSPSGEFKALVADGAENDDDMPPEFRITAVINSLKKIADTRSMWGVGVMYILKKQRENGVWDQRIMVMTEHIAGWGRHWSYPFKLVDGEVKLGAPTETPVKPVYFSKNK